MRTMRPEPPISQGWNWVWRHLWIIVERLFAYPTFLQATLLYCMIGISKGCPFDGYPVPDLLKHIDDNKEYTIAEWKCFVEQIRIYWNMIKKTKKNSFNAVSKENSREK